MANGMTTRPRNGIRRGDPNPSRDHLCCHIALIRSFRRGQSLESEKSVKSQAIKTEATRKLSKVPTTGIKNSGIGIINITKAFFNSSFKMVSSPFLGEVASSSGAFW